MKRQGIRLFGSNPTGNRPPKTPLYPIPASTSPERMSKEWSGRGGYCLKKILDKPFKVFIDYILIYLRGKSLTIVKAGVGRQSNPAFFFLSPTGICLGSGASNCPMASSTSPRIHPHKSKRRNFCIPGCLNPRRSVPRSRICREGK